MLLSKTTGTRTKMVCSTMPKAILGSRSFPSLNWNWRFLAKIEEERFNASIHGFFLRAETPWTLITHDSDPNNSHSDPNKLHCILNDELRNFDVWFKCNKLSVNLQKTISNWSSTYVSNLKRIIYLQKARCASHC